MTQIGAPLKVVRIKEPVRAPDYAPIEKPGTVPEREPVLVPA